MANNNNQIITKRKVVINNYQLEAHSQVAKAIEHLANKHEQLCKSRKSIVLTSYLKPVLKLMIV